MLPRRFGMCAILLLAGCASLPTPEPPEPQAAVVVVEEPPAWAKDINPADRDRIDRLDQAWMEALADARMGRFGRRIREEGALLDPDAALQRPAPSPGSYMCRLIRLGADDRREPPFTAFRPFFCYVGVADNQLSITKQTGSQRPAGYLWEDDDPDRLIFLGSLAPGDDEPLAYGEDPTRDVAGLFERVGAFRYRLVVPWPRNGAKLEVYELIPAPIQDD
ncbi:DUF4893 domain-containing protein [Sphingosinicella rhizophila]|uniref:DUF4893 domain-containing protein n=1 Tax=Sphingosinicella rhizophila TaxID=3050082 RepID=A0ABU3QBM5_9SPHN|nr:DUF4893 domain-containing protein [Sphingosinicella sp. GR2756]MDT9600802.1 DUF4893 domain-containing protein [Sphingosinicella sp. GR2756]